MKILLLSTDFYPNSGGIAVFLHNICLQLCNRGHEVDILTPAIDDCEKTYYIKQPYRVCYYNSLKRFSSLVPVFRTLFMYRKSHYDLIFMGHFMTTHALGVLMLYKLFKVPYLILSHGNDLRYSTKTWIDRAVAKFLMRNATMMLGNSNFVVECIEKKGYEGQIEVLNPGVNVKRFHPKINTNIIIQKYKLEGHRILLSTARLTGKKNIEGILKALPKVINEIPNILCLIVGNGERKDELEVLCDRLGLQNYVRFLGHIKHDLLPSLFCASDLFIMPSCENKENGDIETFGISFIEANACAKPVIGGKSGGITDAVVDEKTGLLVNPNNINEIANAIIRLLNDKELASRLGTNGRRRVEENFDWKVVGKRLEKYLENVVCC